MAHPIPWVAMFPWISSQVQVKNDYLLDKNRYYTAKKCLVILMINVPGTYIMFPGKIHVKAISPSEAPANIFSA